MPPRAVRRVPVPRCCASPSQQPRAGALSQALFSAGLGWRLVTVNADRRQIATSVRGLTALSCADIFLLDIQQSMSRHSCAHRRTLGRRTTRAGSNDARTSHGVNGVKPRNLNHRPSAPGFCKSDRASLIRDSAGGSRVGGWRTGGLRIIVGAAGFTGKSVADGLSLTVGDTITVNVLGRNIEARIANLRQLDWQTLGINFVLLYSPGTFAGAPHTSIATLTYPGSGSPENEHALVAATAREFPGSGGARQERGRRCGLSEI